MNCKVCRKLITLENRVSRQGYHRTVCRLCINKEQREKQRKKAKRIKESRYF